MTIIVPNGFKLSQDGKLWLPANIFFKDAWALAEKLKSKGPYKHIYCLARGGYTFGSIVGNCFDINEIHSLIVKSYDGEDQGVVVFVTDIPEEILKSKGERVLIVDDLVDSGATARAIKKALPESEIATVYSKPKGHKAVDYVGRELPSDDPWVVFAWEENPENFIAA